MENNAQRLGIGGEDDKLARAAVDPVCIASAGQRRAQAQREEQTYDLVASFWSPG